MGGAPNPAFDVRIHASSTVWNNTKPNENP